MTYSDLKSEICSTWLQLNAKQMEDVRLCLLEFSKVQGLSRMRDISRCSDLASALRLLEKWKVLSPQKVEPLLWLTEQIGQNMHAEMVKERVLAYKNATAPPQRAPDRVDQNYQKICEYLSVNLRGRWTDLGRQLGLADTVNELQFRPQRTKDAIHQILQEHAQQTGRDAIPLLLRALENCSLRRQRDDILRNILQ